MNKHIIILFLLVGQNFYVCNLNAQNTPGENYDLSAWKLQTLEESYSSFTQVNPIGTHSSNFFYTNSSDNAIAFRCPSNGGTTSANASYPRVELRQVGAGANWPLSDVTEHYLTAQCRVMEISEVKPKTIIGQIHGHQSNSELLKIRWTGYKPGECIVEARFQTNDDLGSEYGEILASGLSLGDTINYTVSMTQGVINVTVNGNSGSQTYTSDFYGTTDSYYFKAGNYIQWNENIVGPIVISGENLFYKLFLENNLNTSIKEDDNYNSITFYPNPAKDIITFKNIFNKQRVNILSISGELIQSIELSGQTMSIDISNLVNGLYIAQILNIETREHILLKFTKM